MTVGCAASSLAARVIGDPFASLAEPTITSQNTVLYGDGTTGSTSISTGGTANKPATRFVSGGFVTLSPGIYWGGLRITGGNVAMQPGRYVMAGGGLEISGSSTSVSGTNVFVYNTYDPYSPTGAGAYANINVFVNNTSLRAPTASADGYYTGLLFFNDRSTDNSSLIRLTGQFSSAQGFLYSAKGQVQIASPLFNDAGLSVVAQNFSIPSSAGVNLGSLNVLTNFSLPLFFLLVLNNGFTEVHAGWPSVSAGGSVVTINGPSVQIVPILGENISYFGSISFDSAISSTSRFNQVILGKAVDSQGLLVVGAGLQQISSNLVIGSNVTAFGRVLVTGGQLSNATTTIGDAGIGEMTVSNGVVRFGNTVIGNGAGSQGSLTIAGGTNLAATLTVGSNAYASGTLLVTGGQLSNATTTIGDAGIGEMTVSNGVVRFGNTVIGKAPGSQGSLTIAGGTNLITALSLGGGSNSNGLPPPPPPQAPASAGEGGATLVATGVVLVTGGLVSNVATTIGDTGIGRMTVSNGVVRFGDTIVGNAAGSQGSLTIAGGTNVISNLIIGSNASASGSVLVTGGQLAVVGFQPQTTVGDSGNGQMTVSNGIVSLGDTFVGKSAGSQGTLIIAGGSNIVGNLVAGYYPGANGSVLVTGGQLQGNRADIGSLSRGEMIISNGVVQFGIFVLGPGDVSASQLFLAGGTTTVSTVMSLDGTVLVTGGQLTANNALALLGYHGHSQMTVSNGFTELGDVYVGVSQGANAGMTIAGGSNTMGALTIASSPGSTGAVHVTGGNLSVAGRLKVGVSGLTTIPPKWPGQPEIVTNLFVSATLTLDGGTVSAGHLTATNGASSVVNFNGGTLSTAGSTVSNDIPFTVGNGIRSATLNLMGGTHYFANGLSISSNASLIGDGIIIGSVTNFGGIAPGHSPGTLNILGDLTLQDSSVLDMEIGGSNTNQYDRIDVTGLLTAGGWLNVTLTNGYSPAKGATFDLFGFGALTGSFAGINLPTVQNAGFDWQGDPLSGTITFIPEPSSGLLALLGLGCLGVVGRRRG